MAGDEIAIGDAIGCQERESGQFGVLHVELDQIWVEFVGFGKRPSINADAPIYLHTAKGWVVSLFDNIDVSSALPFWRRGDVGTVHRQRIVSNLVLSGETPWRPDDRVLSVSFRLAPDCDFLWASDLAREIAEISLHNETAPDRTILTVPVTGGSVRLAFALGSDPVRNKWTPEDPWFTVRFDDGAEPRECLNRIWYLRALFALLSWRDLRSEGISIRRINAEANSNSHRVLTAELKATTSNLKARRTADRVEHHVDAAPAGQRAHPHRDILAAGVDQMRGTMRRRNGQPVAPGGRRDHLAAQHPRDRDGSEPDAAGHAEHQHALARPQPRAPGAGAVGHGNLPAAANSSADGMAIARAAGSTAESA